MTLPPARRILMTTDAVGGVWVYATELARALCKAGSDVTLVVTGPAPRSEQLQSLHQIRGLRVELTDLALEWMDPEGADTSRARNRLMRIARRLQPHIVHLNSYREASFDWPAPVLVVAHSCVMSWWHACHGGAPGEEHWRRYAAAVSAGLAAADAWIAPTAAMRDAIEASYRPPARGRVIWNGTDLPASDARARQPFILAAGRLWDQAKNLASLAAIAPELDWPVRVAGPLQQPGSMPDHAKIAGLDLLGIVPRADLTDLMQRAGIFAAPAFYEPFGLTVLEAAASGSALVLSDIPSFRELWHGAALFVDPRDERALLSTLQQLSRDASLRTQLQRAAAQRARRYSLGAMVGAYIALYDKMHLPRSLDASAHATVAAELPA